LCSIIKALETQTHELKSAMAGLKDISDTTGHPRKGGGFKQRRLVNDSWLWQAIELMSGAHQRCHIPQLYFCMLGLSVLEETWRIQVVAKV